MNAADFCDWLEKMQRRGFAKSNADCGRLLGVSANTVVTMRRVGTDLRTALACSALLAEMKPYTAEGPTVVRY